MARKKKKKMPINQKIGLILLLTAIILVMLQYICQTYFDIDLGITFFGKKIFN